MKVIGLTGGIGSGKSTVAKMFEGHGVSVYYADQEAKELMLRSDSLKAEIKQLFGEKAYEHGSLNRSFIASIVFRDKDKLNALNKLVHPAVKRHFQEWVLQQTGTYVLQENALIFEKNEQARFDKVILVIAEETTRIQRVMDRDHLSRDQVLQRINNQLHDREKQGLADFVILNESLHDTQVQVARIHKTLSS